MNPPPFFLLLFPVLVTIYFFILFLKIGGKFLTSYSFLVYFPLYQGILNTNWSKAFSLIILYYWFKIV